jgi:hypothetical protein
LGLRSSEERRPGRHRAAGAREHRRRYSASLERASEPDENWDELERSVVANLADDVRIGIKGRDVEITIIKRF